MNDAYYLGRINPSLLENTIIKEMYEISSTATEEFQMYLEENKIGIDTVSSRQVILIHLAFDMWKSEYMYMLTKSGKVRGLSDFRLELTSDQFHNLYDVSVIYEMKSATC